MEFVTGHAGTDHISAADMASLYRGLLIADDVVLDTGQKLGCTMLDANTAEIGTGDCMLQAHHARVDIAEQLTIQSGSNGFNRNDLIVARYTLGTGNVQAIYLAVIEGTAVAGEASDPDYTTGVIDDGAVLVEFPLWRIPLTGITVGEPERIMPTVDTLQDQITDGDAALQSQITALGESVYQSGNIFAQKAQRCATVMLKSATYSAGWTDNILQLPSAFKPYQAGSVNVINVEGAMVCTADAKSVGILKVSLNGWVSVYNPSSTPKDLAGTVSYVTVS